MKPYSFAALLLVTASALVACSSPQTSISKSFAASGAGPAQPAPGNSLNYPSFDVELGHYGAVIVNVQVLADGTVGTMELNQSSGWPGLDNATFDSMANWLFSPAIDANGQPVDSIQPIRVIYREAQRQNNFTLSYDQEVERLTGALVSFQQISAAFFQTCDGLGLKAEQASARLEIDNQALVAQMERLLTAYAHYVQDKPNLDDRDRVERRAAILAKLNLRKSGIDALRARGEPSLRVFCQTLANQVNSSQWNFQHFDQRSHRRLLELTEANSTAG